MSRRSLKDRYQVSEKLKNGLDFPDLQIKLSTGLARALHVNAGEFLPIDLIDERDIKLSEHSGCIYRALKAGWLIDITKPVEVKTETPVAEKKEEVKPNQYKLVETVSPEDFAKMRDKSGVAEVMKTDGPQPAVQVQVIQFQGSMPVQDTQAVVTTSSGSPALVHAESRPDSEAALKANIERMRRADISAGDVEITSFEMFNKMTHFAKLDYIKITNNAELLKSIVEKTEVKQLQNNANGRLRELGVSA